MDSPILHQWQYQDNKDRSPLWYMIALSVSIWLIVWGFLTLQYGMSIVVMIVTGLFYFLEIHSDEIIEVKISEAGIWIQKSFYEYSHIASYSFIYSGKDVIYMRLKLRRSPIRLLSLRIDNSQLLAIENILLEALGEPERQDIWIVDRISHFLKL